jgi:hypothetical protein
MNNINKIVLKISGTIKIKPNIIYKSNNFGKKNKNIKHQIQKYIPEPPYITEEPGEVIHCDDEFIKKIIKNGGL